MEYTQATVPCAAEHFLFSMSASILLFSVCNKSAIEMCYD